MKKIKRLDNKKHWDFKTKALFTGIAVLLALVVILMIVKENDRGKYVITNHSGLKLEYVKLVFVGSEDTVTDPIEIKSLEAGKSSSVKFNKLNLLGKQANLEIRFKFENSKELFVDSGIFNGNFTGKISINFKKSTDDVIKLKVKAANGLLKDKLTDCNDSFNIHLKDGYVE